MSYNTADVLTREAVSVMRACEIAQVSRRTIYNWLAHGKLQYYRTVGGSIRIYVDSLYRVEDNQPLKGQ